MSICECVQKGKPPASTSNVFPSGIARKRESPWPTSIAVISKTPARSCGCGGIDQISKQLVANTAAPAVASIRSLRIRTTHAAIALAAKIIVAMAGVGTRISAS